MASVKVGLGVFCFCDPPNIRFMVWAPRRFDRIYSGRRSKGNDVILSQARMASPNRNFESC